MKSDMPIYKDAVDASAQKIRSVLQERGMLDGFTSSVKDGSTASVSEEIVNAILLHLEQYLAGNASETIDQVSGRIQAKLDSLGESGINVSDEAIERIKNELQTESGGGSAEVLQDVVEILNGVGSKAQKFKDFVLQASAASVQADEHGTGEGVTGEGGTAVRRIQGLPDQKLFIDFIDEVMPDVAFFSDSLEQLQKRLRAGSSQAQAVEGSSFDLDGAWADAVVGSLREAASQIDQAVLKIQDVCGNQAAPPNPAGAPFAALSRIELLADQLAAAAGIAKTSAYVIYAAVGFIWLFTAALIASAAFMAQMLPMIAVLFAALSLAFVASAIALSVVTLVLSAALAVAAVLFSASGLIAMPLMATASSVSAAVTTMVITVFSMSLAVAGSLLAAALSIIASAAAFVITVFAAVVSASTTVLFAALGAVMSAVSVVSGAALAMILAAVSASLAVLVAAGALVAGTLLAAVAIGATATALAVAILVGAAVVGLAALAVIGAAGALLVAASLVAGAVALVLAGVAVAITLGAAVVAGIAILAAGLAFSLALAAVLVVISAIIAATAVAIAAAVAVFTIALTILLILVVAIPLGIVWGLWWAFGKIKNYLHGANDSLDSVEGWMDFFRKNEDGSEKLGFFELIWKGVKALVVGIAKWVAGWGVWKWLGQAWDWISNWAKKLWYAIKSVVVDCKNAFVKWWNETIVDGLVNAGKFSFFGLDVDLFSGAQNYLKFDLATNPPTPRYKVMKDDKAFVFDDGPEEIEKVKRERDDELKENVQQYKERVDAQRREDNQKSVDDIKASGAEVDAELDAFLDEASKRPEVKTPPVPVPAPGAKKSLEEQEG